MIKLFEKYNNIAEIKDMILFKAIGTDDIEVIDFFVGKGYKANDENDIFTTSLYNNDILKYFLEKGVKPFYPNYDPRLVSRLKDEEVQKILINFNYAQFINDTVGFNRALITDDELKEVGIDGVKNFVEMKYDMNKFNL